MTPPSYLAPSPRPSPMYSVKEFTLAALDDWGGGGGMEPDTMKRSRGLRFHQLFLNSDKEQFM